MDKEALTTMLDSCLQADAEMIQCENGWSLFKDPFQSWTIVLSEAQSEVQSEESGEEAFA